VATETRAQRRRRWIKATGLPPPDDRPFTPNTEGDEIKARIDPVYESLRLRLRSIDFRARRRGRAVEEEPYPRRPTWSLPAVPDDAPPSWDNVVRAYEELE
jgi:hypothetical protein